MRTETADKWAAYYHDSYHEQGSLRHVFHKRRIDSLARLVPTPARILDAGCGSGVLCRILADRGCTVAGVDLVPSRVAWSKRITPEAEFQCGDVRSFQFGKRFDVVICSEVLEHFGIKERPPALKNLVGHLESGGTLIVTVPSPVYIRIIEPIWEVIRDWQYGKDQYDDEECHEVVASEEFEASLAEQGCDVRRKGTMCWGLVRWYVACKR